MYLGRDEPELELWLVGFASHLDILSLLIFSLSVLRLKMANSLLNFYAPPQILLLQKPKVSTFRKDRLKPFKPFPSSLNRSPNLSKIMPITTSAAGTDLGLVQKAIQVVHSSPPTWQSAFLSNLVIFVLGTPILLSGLSLSGILAAFLLGTLTWRAFGPSGFFLVAAYFVIVSWDYYLFIYFSQLVHRVIFLFLPIIFVD